MAWSPWSMRFLTLLVLLVTANPLPVATANDGAPLSKISPSNVSELAVLSEIEEDIFEVTWHREGREIAFVRWEQPIQIRDGSSFKLLSTIEDDRRVIHFAFASDLDMFAYCENSQAVRLVSVNTKDAIILETGSPQPFMEFSPDGQFLATGGYGNDAKVWSVRDGHLIHSLNIGGVSGGLLATFSPDSRRLAVGNRNSTTSIFDIATGEMLVSLPKSSSHRLRFDPTGQRLAVAYVDGSIVIWDGTSGEQLVAKKTKADELYNVDWSPDGGLLVTSGLKGAITLWNPEDLSLIRELEAPEWVIQSRFSPDGTRLLTAGGTVLPSDARKVRIWGIPGR